MKIIEIDSKFWNVDIAKGKTIVNAILHQEVVEDVRLLENKRITDNNDYISIPMKDWLDFKEKLQLPITKRKEE